MFDLAKADLVPVQTHGHAGLTRIAACDPEGVVVAMRFGATRIVGIAIHRAEGGRVEAAERTRMRFAMIEERMTDAMAAILRQQ